MKKRKEKRFELRLSDEGDAALTRIAEATGMSRAAIVEALIREADRRQGMSFVPHGHFAIGEPLVLPAEDRPGLPSGFVATHPAVKGEVVKCVPAQDWRKNIKPNPKPGQKGKK